MKERVLKDNYEKFCFLNSYSEMRLSDNLQIFEKYGFTFMDDDESTAFTGLYERKIKQEVDFSALTPENSFELFLMANYQITHIDEDVEWIDEIEFHYSEFCHRYNVIKQEIQAKTISTLYGLTMTLRKRKKLVFNDKLGAQNLIIDINDEEKPEPKGFRNCWNCCKRKSKEIYVIDPQLLEIHTTLLVDPKNSLEKYKDQIESVARKMIRFNGWFRAELAIVYVHLIIKTLFILPMILIVLLMEVNYSFYAFNMNDDNVITKFFFFYEMIFHFF